MQSSKHREHRQGRQKGGQRKARRASLRHHLHAPEQLGWWLFGALVLTVELLDKFSFYGNMENKAPGEGSAMHGSKYTLHRIG